MGRANKIRDEPWHDGTTSVADVVSGLAGSHGRSAVVQVLASPVNTWSEMLKRKEQKGERLDRMVRKNMEH